jgi:hypothetical protein
VPFRGRHLALCLAFGLWGCGADSPPNAPTLQLPFTSSAASPVLFNDVQGVPVGAPGYYAFGVLNAGTQSLTVQSVTYAGDPAMALQPLPQPLPATLAFNGEFIIPLVCTPPAAQSYAGTVSIISDAVNTPLAQVYLSCVGVP